MITDLTPSLSSQQRAWLTLTKPVGLLGSTALLAVPTDFAKEAIERNLRDPITTALSGRLNQQINLAVTVNDDAPLAAPAPDGAPTAAAAPLVTPTPDLAAGEWPTA